MGRKKWNIFLAALMILSLFPVRSYMTQAETVVEDGLRLSKDAKRVEGKLNQWEVNLEVEYEPEKPKKDVMIIVDQSGSMDRIIPGLGIDRMEAAKQSAIDFAEIILDKNRIDGRVAVIGYSTGTKLYNDFTDDFSTVEKSIKSMKYGGGTFTQGALYHARTHMSKKDVLREDADPIVVVLTDGAATYGIGFSDTGIEKLKKFDVEKLTEDNFGEGTRFPDYYTYNVWKDDTKDLNNLIRIPHKHYQNPPVDVDVIVINSDDIPEKDKFNNKSINIPLNAKGNWYLAKEGENNLFEEKDFDYDDYRSMGGPGSRAPLFPYAVEVSKGKFYYGSDIYSNIGDFAREGSLKRLDHTYYLVNLLDTMVAESRFLKHDTNADVYTVALGLDSDPLAKDAVKEMASDETMFFETEGAELHEYFEEIAEKISFPFEEVGIELEDPMGEAFSILEDTLKANQGDTEGLKVENDTITWEMTKNSFEYDQKNNIYKARVTYIVTANENAYELLEKSEDGLLPTNGDAVFKYRVGGKEYEKPFPKPTVKPSVLKVTKELYDEDGNLVSLEDDKHQRKYHYHLDLGEKEDQTFENYLTHGKEDRYHLYQTEDKVHLYETEIEHDDLDRFEVRYFFETDDGEYEELEVDAQGRAIFQLKPNSGINHFIIRNYPKKDYQYEDYTIEKSVVDENANNKAEIGETLTYTIDVTNEKDAFIREVEIQDKLDHIIDYVEEHDENKVTVKRNGQVLEESWTVKDLKEGIRTHLDKEEALSLSFDLKIVENEEILTNVKELVNTARVNEKEDDSKIDVVLPKYKATKTVKDANKNGYAEAGERLDYTITVENTGDVRIPNLKVQDKFEEMIDYLQKDQLEEAMVSYQDKQVPLKTMIEEGFVIEEIAVDETVEIKFSVYLKEDLDVDKVTELENIATVGDENPETSIKTAKPILSSQKEVELVDNKSYVEAGDEISYRIKIVNDGKVAKADTLVRDELSDLLDYLDTAQFEEADRVKVLNAEGKVIDSKSLQSLQEGFELEVPAKSSVVLNFDLKFKEDLSDLDDRSELTNVAIVSTEDPNKPDKPSVTVPFAKPIIVSEKTLTEEFEDGIIEPGEKIAYTIRIENKGTALKKDLFIQDDMTDMQALMDDSTPYGDLQFSMEKNGEIEYFPIEKLHQGFHEDLDFEDKMTIHFEFKVREDLDLDKVEEIENIATVGEETPKVTRPTGKPNLVTSKEVKDENENGFAEAGERLDYTLTLENTGSVTKRNVFIQDTLEDVLEHIQEDELEFSLNGDKHPIAKLQEGFKMDLKANEKIEITFSVTMREDLDTDDVKSILNQAVLGEDVPKVEIPTGKPNIVAEKSVKDDNGNGFAEAGEELTYTISIENTGEVQKENAWIQDDLKDMIEYLEITEENVFILNDEEYPLSQLMEGFERTIEADEKIEITFTLKVKDSFDADDMAEFINTAKVDEERPQSKIKTGKPRISIEKTVQDENQDGRAEVGEALSYEILVKNYGEVKKDEVFIQDTLFDLKDYVEDLDSVRFDLNGEEKAIQALMDGFTISLDAQEEVKIQFEVIVSEAMDAIEVTELINTATADEEEVRVKIPTGKAIIRAEKFVADKNNDGFAEPGEDLTYTIRVQNDGTVKKKDLLVQDDLSEIKEYFDIDEEAIVSAAGEFYSLKELMEGIEIDLEAGEVIDFVFTLSVKEDLDLAQGTMIENTATVGPEKPSTKIPFGKAEIIIHKNVSDDNDDDYAEAGEELDYSILVQNIGKVAKDQVFIQDKLEDVKEHFVDLDKVAMSVNGEERPLSDLIEGFHHDFASGESLNITFTVQIKEELDASVVESLINTATADNEKDRARIDTGEAIITAYKFVEDVNEKDPSASGNMHAEAGEILEYTLLVHNKGKVAEDNLFIKDDFADMKEWLEIDEKAPVKIEKLDSKEGAVDFEERTVAELLQGFEMEMPLGAGESVEIKFAVQVKDPFEAKIGQPLINEARVGPEKPRVEIPAGKQKIYAKKEVREITEGLVDKYLEAGEQLEYIIVVGNSGNVATTEAIPVKDDLEELLPYIQEELDSVRIFKDGQETAYTLEDLRNGIDLNLEAEEEIRLSFTVTLDGFDADEVTQLQNTAIVGDLPDPEQPSVTVPTGKPQILAQKSVSDANNNGYAEAGEVLEYRLKVVNAGEVKKRGLLLKDEMKDMIDFVVPGDFVIVESSREDVSSQNFAMDSFMNEGVRVDLAPAEELTFTFSVKVKDDLDVDAIKSLNNIATVGEKDPNKPWEDEPITPETSIPTGKARIEAKKVVEDENGDGFVEAGERLTYTIHILNHGEVADENVLIKDELTEIKDLLESVENIPLEGDVENKTLEDLIEGFEIFLDAGEEKSIAFTVQVREDYDSDEKPQLMNQAQVGPETPENEIPGGKAKLQAWKKVEESIKDGYVEAGEDLSYTISVHNYGTVTYRDLKIQDDLADILDHIEDIAGLEYSLSSNKRSADELKASRGSLQTFVEEGIFEDLLPGETLNVEFTVTARKDLNTDEVKEFANMATIAEEDPLTPDVNIPSGKAKIIASKSVEDENKNGYAEAGERLDYSIHIQNVGEVAKRNLFVQDSLEDILEHIEPIKDLDLEGVEGKTVQDLVDGFEIDLDAKESVEIKFSVKVKENFDADEVKEFTNLAVIGEDDPEKPTVTIPTGKPIIEAEKKVFDENGDGFAEAGEELTYQIIIKNKGPVAHEKLFVQDELKDLSKHLVDEDVEIKNAPVGTKLSDLMNGFYMRIDAKETVTLEFVVTISEGFDAEETLELTNLAVIGEKEPEKPTVTIPSGKPIIKAEKKIFDENGDGFVEAGERLDYRIFIRNEGKVAKKGLYIQDDLKDLMDHIEPIESINLSGDLEGKTLQNLVDGFEIDLDAKESLEIKFSVVVKEEFDATTVEKLANKATIGPEEPSVEIPSGYPIISAEKFVEDENKNQYAEAGENLSYTIRIKNEGLVAKEKVFVKDDLIDMIDYIESTDVELEIKELEEQYSLEDLMEGIYIDIPAKASRDLRFTVRLIEDLNVQDIESIRNVASVGEEDPIYPETEIPTAEPIITATKKVEDENGDGFAEAGEHLDYTLSITNSGKVDKKDLFIQDELKGLIDHIETIEDIPLTGYVSDKSLKDLVEGFEIDLAANETAEIHFTVQIKEDFDSDKHGKLVNVAQVGKDEPITPEVEIPSGKADIKTWKFVEDANQDGYAEAGEILTYTIRIHNQGEVSKKNLFVQDDLTKLSKYLDFDESASMNVNGAIRPLSDLIEGFNLDIASGETIDIIFDVKVNEELDSDAVPSLVNIATVGEDLPSVEIKTGQAVIKTTKSVSDANGNAYAEAGERLDYMITVENTGDVKKEGLFIQDSLSEMIDYLEDVDSVKVSMGSESISLQELQKGIHVDLDAQETLTLNFSVKLKDTLPVDHLLTIQNTVYVDDVPTTAEIPVGSPKLSIQKSVFDANQDAYVEAGESLSYVIEVKNTGLVGKVVVIKDDLKHVKDYLEIGFLDKMSVNGKEMPLRKLIKGFEYELASNETVEIRFDLKAKDELDTEELYNIAYVDEVFDEVSIPVKGKADSLPKEPAHKDPLKPFLSSPHASLPPTGVGHETIIVSVMFLLLGFLLAWRDDDEE